MNSKSADMPKTGELRERYPHEVITKEEFLQKYPGATYPLDILPSYVIEELIELGGVFKSQVSGELVILKGFESIYMVRIILELVKIINRTKKFHRDTDLVRLGEAFEFPEQYKKLFEAARTDEQDEVLTEIDTISLEPSSPIQIYKSQTKRTTSEVANPFLNLTMFEAFVKNLFDVSEWRTLTREQIENGKLKVLEKYGKEMGLDDSNIDKLFDAITKQDFDAREARLKLLEGIVQESALELRMVTTVEMESPEIEKVLGTIAQTLINLNLNVGDIWNAAEQIAGGNEKLRNKIITAYTEMGKKEKIA